MKSVAPFAVVLCSLAACAQGEAPDDLDAPGTAIDAPGTTADAPTVDALPPIDAAIDAPIDAAPAGPPDTCAQALDITAAAMVGTGVVLTGDLTGYANDIQPASTCTGFTNDGPDAVYVLTNLAAGRTITATVDAPTWDSSVEIVQPCTLTPTCLVGRDAGNPESVTFTTTAPGTYHVIVDSWDAGAFGAYTLTVRVQ